MGSYYFNALKCIYIDIQAIKWCAQSMRLLQGKLLKEIHRLWCIALMIAIKLDVPPGSRCGSSSPRGSGRPLLTFLEGSLKSFLHQVRLLDWTGSRNISPGVGESKGIQVRSSYATSLIVTETSRGNTGYTRAMKHKLIFSAHWHTPMTGPDLYTAASRPAKNTWPRVEQITILILMPQTWTELQWPDALPRPPPSSFEMPHTRAWVCSGERRKLRVITSGTLRLNEHKSIGALE